MENEYFRLLKEKVDEVIKEEHQTKPPDKNNYSTKVIVKKEGNEKYWKTIAALTFGGLLKEEKRASLHSFRVNEDYRNNGIGTLVMLSTLCYLKKEGVEEVSLDIKIHNENAKRLYNKIGFKPIPIKKEKWLGMIIKDLQEWAFKGELK